MARRPKSTASIVAPAVVSTATSTAATAATARNEDDHFTPLNPDHPPLPLTRDGYSHDPRHTIVDAANDAASNAAHDAAHDRVVTLLEAIDPRRSGHILDKKGRIKRIKCGCGRMLTPDANGNAPCLPDDGGCGVIMGVVRYRPPSRPQGRLAKFPLVRPGDESSIDAWAAYRGERRRRVVVRRERKGRIARRESPHDPERCEVCQVYAPGIEELREREISVREVAERSLLSSNHIHRVLNPNIEHRRGLRTLTTMRRIAHDGLGISLDELALILELK